MIYFTADTHWSHNNIITLCNRPFEHIHEMNKKLIENWNSVVQPEDTVYHLGDIAFKNTTIFHKLKDTLNGKIYLVKGNHDGAFLKWNQQHHFVEVLGDLYEFWYEKQYFVLSHYPLLSWHWMERAKSINLHGHCHGNVHIKQNNQYDVGIDYNNFTPISIEKFLKK